MWQAGSSGTQPCFHNLLVRIFSEANLQFLMSQTQKIVKDFNPLDDRKSVEDKELVLNKEMRDSSHSRDKNCRKFNIILNAKRPKICHTIY